MLEVTPELILEDSELEERFVRASGPGGQNVNKVATAVELRFDAQSSQKLTEEVRERLRAVAGTRMTNEGVILIDARRHRTQAQNREDARQRLAELLRQALVKPKRRRKTRPTKGAVEKRVQSKKRRAETKRGRGRVGDAD
jgi:ribosome-associated protein